MDLNNVEWVSQPNPQCHDSRVFEKVRMAMIATAVEFAQLTEEALRTLIVGCSQ